MKTVNYYDYLDALDALRAGIDRRIEIRNMRTDNIIEMGVNFCALGAIKPADAIKYAQNIQRAAELAADFPLNGYRITY